MKGRWCHRNCFLLAGVGRQLLLLSLIIIMKSCNFPVSLAVGLWNCVMFSWLYWAELKENSSYESLGHLTQHDVIRIVFNTLNVVNNVGPDSPHDPPYWATTSHRAIKISLDCGASTPNWTTIQYTFYGATYHIPWYISFTELLRLLHWVTTSLLLIYHISLTELSHIVNSRTGLLHLPNWATA